MFNLIALLLLTMSYAWIMGVDETASVGAIRAFALLMGAGTLIMLAIKIVVYRLDEKEVKIESSE